MPVNNFNYQLSSTWSDFNPRSSRPTGVNEDAQIHPEMSFSAFQPGRKGNAIIIADVTIDIAVVPDDTWVVTSQQSPDLLKHEQGHYDILAICAREIYNAILALSGRSTNDLQTKINSTKERIGRKVTQIDVRYDTRTNHSQNTTEQQTWDQRIATVKQNPNGTLDDLP